MSDTRQAKTYSLLLQDKDRVRQSVLTSFNHLNEISVNVGDTVEKGWRIGLIGETAQGLARIFTGVWLYTGLQ